MAATCWGLLMVILLQQLSEGHTLTGHVCSQRRSRSVVVYQLTSRLGTQRYTTNCGLLWLGRCIRYRSHIYYFSEPVYKTQYYQTQVCCPGWQQTGSTCYTPICSGGCVHGSCTAPGVCTCRRGFRGSRCQYTTSCRGGCVHGFCTAPNVCDCNRGYRGSLCQYDINECSTGNGGCEYNCTNTVGSFFCTCRTGFVLDGNGLNCSDINECSTGNGGCAHTCTNTVGSFFCTCRTGFVLDGNGLTCSDVDECSNGTHVCDHNCHNTRGNYTCSCRNGYELASDGRGCIDVDECSKGTHACDHNCHNTRGSYTCSCRNGYELAPPVCIATKQIAFASCPNDLQSHTASNASRVTWPIPEVTDYTGNITIKGNNNPGHVFPVGSTVVTYTAEDTAGNKATCNFIVDVKRVVKECRDEIPVPDRATLSCRQPAQGRERCDVTCLSDPSNIRQNPDIPQSFVCNPEGKWEPPFEWGAVKTLACLTVEPPKSYRVLFNMKHPGACVDDVYFKPFVVSELIKWLRDGDMCPEVNFIKLCHMSQVNVICKEEEKDSHDGDLTVYLTLYATFTSQRNGTDDHQKVLAVVENVTNFINNNQFVFEYGSNNYTFETKSRGEVETTCIQRQMKISGEYCVKCPPGTNYNTVLNNCDSCPANTYQERRGQSVCIKCKGDKTSPPGSFSRYDCQDTTQRTMDTAARVDIPITIGVALFAVIVVAIFGFVVCKRCKINKKEIENHSQSPPVNEGHNLDSDAYDYAEDQSASTQRTERNRDGRQQTNSPNVSNPDRPYESIMIRDGDQQRVLYTRLNFRGETPTPIGEYESLSVHHHRAHQNAYTRLRYGSEA